MLLTAKTEFKQGFSEVVFCLMQKGLLTAPSGGPNILATPGFLFCIPGA